MSARGSEMKILVCVKAIPQTDHGITKDENGQKIIPIMQSGYRLNAWDSCVVEAAIALKESGHADIIDVITCTVKDADSPVRRALGMGADTGIHIVHKNDEAPDSMTVAKLIAATVKHKGGYDLILCGAMSEDRMEAATGPMIASLLEIPFTCSVVEMEIRATGNAIAGNKGIRAACEMDGGLRKLISLECPALVTLQTGINIPRYPKLSAMLRANQADLETIEAGSFSSKQKVSGYRTPESTRKTRMLQGSVSEKAADVVKIMKEKGLI